MSISLNVNGALFTFPTDGEDGWGESVTAWAAAITSGLLQKQGGNFFLTADTVLGDNFAIKGQYYKFISGVVSDGKTIELKAPDTAIAASYSLVLPTTQGAQYDVIKFSAAGVTSVGKIDNSNIDSAAAIVFTKMAALTANKVLVSNGSGVVVPSSITDTELAFLTGLSENVQNSIDTLQADVGTLVVDLGITNNNVATLNSQNVKITGDQTIAGVKTFNSPVKVQKSAASDPVVISASDIDFATGSVFTKTLAANTTFTFSNDVSGQTILVLLTNTASNYTVTFPVGVKWQNQVAPVMTTGAKSDLFSFTKIGSTVYGAVIQNL